MKRVAWIVVALASVTVATYASIFVVAEVITEIVVLRTYDSDGSPHETRLTVIDRAGEPWVRGRSYRGWFRRVVANPKAELYRAGQWSSVRATISRERQDAAAFDQVMLESYGFPYRYVDLIARVSSTEIPVRLASVPPEQRSNKAMKTDVE